jgi:hypothetical protein
MRFFESNSALELNPKVVTLTPGTPCIAQPDRPRLTIWHMHIACWINKATNTYLEYVILAAFLRQKWLHERASMLCYTCIDCIVYNSG